MSKPMKQEKQSRAIRSYLIFCCACAVLLSGFGRVSLTGPVATEFMIVNAEDTATNTFSKQDNVYFSYRITNTGEQPITWRKPDGGPIAFVQVYSNGALVGSTMDQSFYTQALEKGTLKPGGSLSWKQSWIANGVHDPLPPGQYTAVVRPRIALEKETLLPQEKQFRVADAR